MANADQNPHHGYLIAVSGFLKGLMATQRELIEIQTKKRSAMIARDLTQLSECQREERKHQQRLTMLIGDRNQLIQNLNRDGLTGETLHQIALRADWLTVEPLRIQFEEVKKLSEKLRTQSWSLWTIAHRASRHFEAALELIAQGGNRSQTYHENPHHQADEGGGSLLDASI